MFIYIILSILAITRNINQVNGFVVKIINGVDAADNEAQFQVMIYRKIPGIVNSVCNGMLYKPDKVLTAAHCVGPGAITIRYGTRNLKNNIFPDVEVKNYVEHPDSKFNDIAILVLKENIEENSQVKYAQFDNVPVAVNDIVTVYGWGKENKLDKSYPQTLKKTVLTIEYISDNGIFGRSKNSTICYGDSGGAMVSSRGKLVGIASKGQNCTNNDLNFYTKISSYRNFIDSN